MKTSLRTDLNDYDSITRQLHQIIRAKNGQYKADLKRKRLKLEDKLGISLVWKAATQGFAKGFIAGAAVSATLACTAGVYIAGVASVASILFPPAIFLIPAFYTFIAVAAVAGGILTGVISAGVEAYQRSKYNHFIRSFIVKNSEDKLYLEPNISSK